jgi:hypothetical protein
MPGLESFNIEQYKSRFGDGAKASLFYYQPTWPAGIGSLVTPENAMYLVKSTQIPSTTIETGTLNWQGFDYKYATKHTYSTITVTFNVDLKAKIRLQFENWMNLMHNPLDNTYATSSEYMADQRLQMVGYQAETLLEFTLHHAFPTEIAQISLDYSTPEVATFDITLTYQYHTIKTSETGGAAAQQG